VSAVAAARALATVAVAAALAGCSLAPTTPHIRYYTLAVTGTPPTHLDAPVRVGTFTADQPYATERIAFRSSPYRLDYYTYHRWAADPRDLLRAATRDYFERAAGTHGSPYEIEGHLRRLEEVDQPAEWQGALALDVRVTRGGVVVLDRVFHETEPAESRNPEAVAAALSRALQRVLDQVLTELAGGGAAPAPDTGAGR
jgi:ABC-type uncharacterized transport system auxiliary subunit